MLFHEIFPYQSKLYEVTKSISFDDINRLYISQGLYDRAISQSLEKTQQDKEIDKVGGRISEMTWYHLTRILLDPDSDPLICQEVIRFIRLLEQYNPIEGYPEVVKEDLFSLLAQSFSCNGPVDPKIFSEKYLVCLSLLRIPTEKGEEAIKRSLEEKSYQPLIDLLKPLFDLLQPHDSSDFPQY
jgi:hypothetical protein